ncbi:MAG: Asp23/Gls24 family envelope stress response protein [Oscillospiraceae bacterium]|nr:Asp23/Gls24 family envelope stress response protein [Oscillospiraceae bacterium]
MNKAADTNVNCVKVSEDVISRITEIAISGVEGVCGFAKGKISFANLFTRAGRKPAVRVKTENGAVEVSAEINVSDSCKVKSAAEKIQQRVKDDIQSMTGIAVTKVNVFVKGIVFENE